MEEKITIEDRINLKKLMEENAEYVDNTNHIRQLKHSEKIRDDVRKINYINNHFAELKQNDREKYVDVCRTECVFLYNNYTDIFNRLVKDEIDLSIMTQLLTVLKMIEDEKINQEDGSIMVGKVLKRLYVDSALKRSENIDKEHQRESSPEEIREVLPISWKQYKLLETKQYVSSVSSSAKKKGKRRNK
jgi:hypothetical protein